MRKANKTLRVMGYAAPVALTLALAAPLALGHGPTDKSFWSAKGENTGWTTRYAECWQSKTGPSDLSPCMKKPEPLRLMLRFPTNGDVIKGDYDPQNRIELEKLKEYIAKLASGTSYPLSIVGHTDSVGSPDSNIDLSERRAAAVRDYIIGMGYEGEITSKGEGEVMALQEVGDGVDDVNYRMVEVKAM